MSSSAKMGRTCAVASRKKGAQLRYLGATMPRQSVTVRALLCLASPRPHA